MEGTTDEQPWGRPACVALGAAVPAACSASFAPGRVASAPGQCDWPVMAANRTGYGSGGAGSLVRTRSSWLRELTPSLVKTLPK